MFTKSITQRSRGPLPYLLLVIAVLAVFGNSLLNGFVWDDFAFIVGNKVYTEFNLHHILVPLYNGIEYFPLRDLSFALDYLIWGETAVGFHLTSLMLYCLNVVVVYYLAAEVSCLLRGDGESNDPQSPAVAPFLAALFFAVHPIHSEVVDAVFNRGALMSGLFFFLSCFLFLRFLRHGAGVWWNYAGALLCFILALLSKAYGIILPLILLLFLAFAAGQKRGKSLFSTMSFFLISLAFYFLYKYVAIQNRMFVTQHLDSIDSSLAAKTAVALQIPFFYLKKLVAPFGFSAEYDVTFANRVSAPAVILSILGLSTLFAAAVYLRRKYPEILFGLCWFMATLIPMLHFFATNPIIADRYAYLPSFGPLCCAALFAARFLNTGLRPLVLTCVVMLVVFWSVTAFTRNTDWKDDKSLWAANIKTSPKQPKSYWNLGNVYFEQGNYVMAFDLFSKLRELNPESDYYTYYKGLLCYNREEFQEAISLFNKALLTNKEHFLALYYLGSSYEKSGNYRAAVASYNRALASRELVDPRLRESTKSALARTLDELGLYEEALRNYRELARFDDRNWQIYYNMGTVCKKMKRYEDAVQYYGKSISLNPAYPDTLNNLGLVYKEMKRYDLAIDAYKKAIVVNSQFSYAPFNLAVLYLETGDRQNALHYFRYTQDRFPELRPMVAPFLKKLQ